MSEEPSPRSVAEGELLWTPSSAFVERSQLAGFSTWLTATRELRFTDYEAMWKWSVTDPDAFWSAIWDYFEVESSTPYSAVRAGEMPRTRWFPGSRINFAEHLLRYEKRARPGEVAIVHSSELRAQQTLSWHELGAGVRTLATQLRELGVVPGDRVVAYMPNIPETAIAMLATTAIGASWSCAAPELGARAVLDRFAQIEPNVVFAVDGYRFAGKNFDRTAEIEAILAGLPSVQHVIWLPYLDPASPAPADRQVISWAEALAAPTVAPDVFSYERVAPDHPLWILFTSGTTGLPKAIVHGHVGVLLEQLKSIALNLNLRPGSRVFLYTNTSWVIWNALVCGLMHGSSIVLFDGHPAHPEPDLLWKIAAQTGVTLFGASPAYVAQMQKANIVPKDVYDLGRLEMIFLAGSPATPESFVWFYDNVKADLWVASQCGSTDMCGGLVGSVATRPVFAGEIQGRLLGIDVHVWDDAGNELIDGVGELVLTTACPSMPLYFWNDPGDERYRESYFSTYPGVWRQGDFIKINARGGAYVYGRSDATLKRFGVRIGSAEIYRCIERLDEVADSLIVCVEKSKGNLAMPLFVKLAPGLQLDDAIKATIVGRLRTDCSLWHVPDEIHAVPDIPYTLSAKKMEVAVRRILEGVPAEAVAARDAMRNPAALDWFVAFAAADAARAQARALRALAFDSPSIERTGLTGLDVAGPIANAWRRAFDPQMLSADDAFEASGGDSLRLFKFVYHLEAELGHDVPLDLFAGSSRPSDFAAALDHYLRTKEQRSDGAPQIFFLPGRAGDDPRVAAFRADCRSALDIVALEYPDWPEMARADFNFEALVAHALAQIEDARPTGPVHLAGYSLGGNVAYACSVALAAAGRAVSLTIFDADIGLARSVAARPLPQRAAELIRSLRDPERRALTLARLFVRRLTMPRARPLLRLFARLRNVRMPYDFDFYVHPTIAESLTMSTLAAWERDLAPPLTRLDVPVTVFRCADRAESEPEDLGWGTFCSDVTVIHVPGTHVSMFQRENRAALCRAFLSVMEIHLAADKVRAGV